MQNLFKANLVIFFKALKLKLLSYRTMFQPIRKCTRLIKITNDVVRGGIVKIVVLGKCYQLVNKEKHLKISAILEMQSVKRKISAMQPNWFNLLHSSIFLPHCTTSVSSVDCVVELNEPIKYTMMIKNNDNNYNKNVSNSPILEFEC